MFYKQQVEKEKLKVAEYSFPATFTTAHEPSSTICSWTIFTSALYVVIREIQ